MLDFFGCNFLFYSFLRNQSLNLTVFISVFFYQKEGNTEKNPRFCSFKKNRHDDCIVQSLFLRIRIIMYD